MTKKKKKRKEKMGTLLGHYYLVVTLLYKRNKHAKVNMKIKQIWQLHNVSRALLKRN